MLTADYAARKQNNQINSRFNKHKGWCISPKQFACDTNDWFDWIDSNVFCYYKCFKMWTFGEQNLGEQYWTA